MTTTEIKVIDGDGHVVEDIATIWKYMPDDYVGRSFSDARGKSPFPPIDHLHTANRHFTPTGAFANVGREGWELFLEDVGIGTTVLYTSAGLAFGKIVSRDWAIELARAYNNWIYDTYLSKSSRFKAMGLIPLQEPVEAVAELRRIVRDLGFCGAMLPSMGVNMPHLGSEKYWSIYGEAERLGCALAVHGGAHEGLLMDDFSPYAPVNALGHPMSQMICFAGIVFNGIFDKFPGLGSVLWKPGRPGCSPVWSASPAPGKAMCSTIPAVVSCGSAKAKKLSIMFYAISTKDAFSSAAKEKS